MAFMDSMRFFNIIRDDGDLLSATPNDVLSGKMFVGKTKKFQQGEIPVLQNYSNVSLLCGQSFTVAYGHNTRDYTVTAVDLLSQTSGTMTENDLLFGRIGWVNGVQITGTMYNNGMVNVTLDAGESYSINIGYHNGLGRVSARSLAEQTIGTALAEHILIGKTAWVNGINIAGTMINNTAESIVLECCGSYNIQEGYHNGTGKVTAASLSSQTQGTAAATDIAFGKIAWVNGIQITGSIPLIATQTVNIPINGTYIIPAGIHGGLGKVTQSIETINGLIITPSFEDQTIEVAEKYMLSDITVTGIDAFNFARSYNENLFSDTVTLTAASGTKELIRLGTDNWHDAFTLNIYNLATQLGLNGTFLGSKKNCVAMIDNLVQSANDGYAKARIYEDPINNKYIDIKVTVDTVTYEHIFTMTWTLSNITTFNQVKVVITDGPRFRKYGDSHDI